MDMVFLEVTERLDPQTVSVWIPASKILSFVVDHRPDDWTAILKVEAVGIRSVHQYPVTPWLNSLADAEAARRQLIRLLVDAHPTQVVRWNGSAFVCEDH